MNILGPAYRPSDRPQTVRGVNPGRPTGRLNHFGTSSSTSTPDAARSGICLSLLLT
jgi:hypothetical protein